jgi:hypothetical protein
MSTSKKTKTITKAKRLARPALRTKRASSTMSSIAQTAMTHRPSTSQALGIGAALAATGLATGAAFFMRGPLAKLVRIGIEDAMSAGDFIGKGARRASSTVAKELDLGHLLAMIGLPRRRSLFSRMLPGLGALAGLLAAAGTTALVLRSRRLPQAEVQPATGVTPDLSSSKSDRGVDFAPSVAEHNSFSEASHVHS